MTPQVQPTHRARPRRRSNWRRPHSKHETRQLRLLSVTPSALRPGEIAVDLFAGGGGWSEGFVRAAGVPPAVAINHDEHAIAMHRANHPETKHFQESVWAVPPRLAVCGHPVGWLHLSPDCCHFSRAKGGKPVKKSIRGLAWVALKWAAQVSPRILSLENVAEFTTWGPLIAKRDKRTGRVMKVDGTVAAAGEVVPIREQMLVPDPRRRGEYFRQWCRELQKLGYTLEWRTLRACDFGAPTSRKRLFVLGRRDGRPIVWPTPTHGPRNSAEVIGGKLLPYVPAAACIDWTIETKSIFDRKKPLAEATLRRIAEGIRKFLLECDSPFLINLTHGARIESVYEPMKTLTAAHRGEKAVVSPIIAKTHSNGSDGFASGVTSAADPTRTLLAKDGLSVVAPVMMANNTNNVPTSPEDPIGAITTGNRHFAVAPSLIQAGYGEREGQAPRTLDIHEPLGTVVGQGMKHSLVAAFMAQHNTGETGHSMTKPVSTIVEKGCTQALVSASLTKLYGTAKAGADAEDPMPTVTGQGGHLGVVEAPLLTKYYGNERGGQSVTEPLHTVTVKDRCALVKAFLQRYLPGMTFEGDYVSVTIAGVVYVIVDIGMRMLVPRELARATGFPDDYLLFGTQTQQVARIGNAVPPAFAEALVRANLDDEEDIEVAA